MKPLLGSPFAHRGLHGARAVENSRAAFAAAIAAGHGIELDVQLSRDGHAMVIHDHELDRLTEESGPLSGRTAAELQRIALRGTRETIPDLPEILRLIAGKVPLLIELKTPERRVEPLCLAVFRALDGYRGPVGVMSFNPEVPNWFASHAPRVTRGLVVTEQGRRGLRERLQRRLALWRASPEFLAYDVRDLPSRLARNARARGIPVLTWTVRDRRQASVAAKHADQIIYERPPAP